MKAEISQKMTHQEREKLKSFNDECATQGDIQSLQMTLRMIAHWMRQREEISFNQYAAHWTAAQADREDGNHSTPAMIAQWPLTGEPRIKKGYSDYIARKPS